MQCVSSRRPSVQGAFHSSVHVSSCGCAKLRAHNTGLTSRPVRSAEMWPGARGGPAAHFRGSARRCAIKKGFTLSRRQTVAVLFATAALLVAGVLAVVVHVPSVSAYSTTSAVADAHTDSRHP